MTKIAVLVSGSGTNLQAIIDAVDGGSLPTIEIMVVVSNRREAYGARRAIRHGIPLVYFPLLPYKNVGRTREDYDTDLAQIVQGFGAEWVVLAGWMHVLSNAFISRFPQHILNLHPALPGTFPGTHAIQRAFEAYQRGETDHTGIMVHLVPDEAIDAGPVIAQQTIPILPEDNLETLEARIHEAEHALLVQAIQRHIPRG